MRDLISDLERWLTKGERIALATVISTWGSAPRPAGSFMAVNEKGEISGSVSGGCVESAVVEASRKVLNEGKAELLHFGVADETAWNVGLACGGEIDVFIQPFDEEVFNALIPKIKSDEDVKLASLVSGPEKVLGVQFVVSQETLIHQSELPDFGEDIAQSLYSQMMATTAPTLFSPESAEQYSFFIAPITASPTLIMVGGVHIAIALAAIARTLHFRTVIVDPRRAFGTTERFAHANQLIQAYPGEAFQSLEITSSTAIASLSHDPKIDDPALLAALSSSAFYIGALGSKKTQQRRLKRLADEHSVSEIDLKRIKGPIGLAIGALTPEEIALAIMAQVIAEYRS